MNLSCLYDGGCFYDDHHNNQFNAHENKKGVEKELRQVVENASRDFQEVIQFHEERKRKADQNIGQRSRGKSPPIILEKGFDGRG